MPLTGQIGIIKLKGTIGDITFYKTQEGHLARKKVGISIVGGSSWSRV